MEEEILEEIEEETTEEINYDIMRYELDENGYIFQVYFGCSSGTCTGYTGAIPDGYDSLEEWYEDNHEMLNAWRIIDDNLAYDPKRYEALETKCEKEAEDNRPVCHKEISNLTNLVKSDNADNYERSTSILSNLIEVTDSNKFASTYIELFTNKNISNKLHIKFNNGNLLTNSATSKMDSGISFEVNADRTINIKGTATNDIEYDIGGYPNNTKPILAFKKGINYYLSSNDYQIKMYNFDGTDREEIYSGNGGVINFTDNDRKVTQIVLFIPNGTEVNETLKLMLNLGTNEKEYIAYQGNEAIVYLGENTFYKGDNIKIEDGMPVLQNEIYISDDLIIGDDFIIGGDLFYLNDIEMPVTYLGLTYMYCMEDVNLKVTYPNIKKNNDLTGYETPNGGFIVDEEGNITANNATLNKVNITGGWANFTSDEEHAGLQLYIDDDKFTSLYEDLWQQLDNGYYVGVKNGHVECYGDYFGTEGRNGRSKYSYNEMKLENDTSYSSMTPNGVWAPSFNNNSLAKQKKNFKLLDNALEIIKNTDIYKYNWQYEEDGSKQHIGFVIGENYKYSKEITSINDENEEVGADIYSMVSTCFKAIKEQQEQIEKLKNIIKELKESDINGEN